MIGKYRKGCIDGPIQPQLANKFFVDFEHPYAGKIKYMLSPIEFSETPAQIKSAAPEYAQHTEEILLEIGYSWDDIAKLKDEEII